MGSVGESVTNGAGGASGGLARDSRRLEPFACAYAFTASRKWLVGMLTLVSSLARHNEPTDACVYRVLWHPSISDTVLTAAERGMLTETARTARVEWVQVDSRRYATYRQLPYLRDGAIQSLVKLELFYNARDEVVVFLDVDMLILKSISFVAEHVAAARDLPWRLHGSSNFYGVSGWVHSAEVTPKVPKHINCGFLAFSTPAPADFINRIERRIYERTRDRIEIFSADQDIINHGLRKEQYAVHTDWYTNYRPNSDATLARWRVAHWLGIEKPWGVQGHTRGEVRYNDRTLPQIDALWADECRAVRATLSSRYPDASIDCRTPTRELPGLVHPLLVRAVGHGVVIQLCVVGALIACERRGPLRGASRAKRRSVWGAVVCVSFLVWFVYMYLFGLSDSAWLRLCHGTCQSGADWFYGTKSKALRAEPPAARARHAP